MEEKVLEIFAKSDKPLDAKGVAAILGIEKPEISKAIAKLKKAGELVSPKVCFYEIAKK